MSYGTIFDIKKFAIHDGPGIRTTVFFKGCPLDCAWCHNPESRSSDPEEVINYRSKSSHNKTKTIGYKISVEQVLEEILKDQVFYDESNGGVTFSGGEPMLQVDFLHDLLTECKKYNLHTTVDTCGYVEWENFERVHDLVDLYLFDLKIMDPEKHAQYTTVSNNLINDNLQRLAKAGLNVRVRVPLIENISDTDENIGAVIRFLEPIKTLRTVDILPYNKFGQDKIERYGLQRPRLDLSTQTADRITHIQNQFKSSGFDVHVGG